MNKIPDDYGIPICITCGALSVMLVMTVLFAPMSLIVKLLLGLAVSFFNLVTVLVYMTADDISFIHDTPIERMSKIEVIKVLFFAAFWPCIVFYLFYKLCTIFKNLMKFAKMPIQSVIDKLSN